MANKQDVHVPEVKSDIAVRRHWQDNTTLDIFVETDELYDRVLTEAPCYGEVDQENSWEFIRVNVAPTFDADEVANYLGRDYGS